MPAVQTNVPANGGTPKNDIPIRFLKRSFNAAIALVFLSSSLMLFFFRLAGCACNPARPAPMRGVPSSTGTRGGDSACTNYVRKVGDTTRPARVQCLTEGGGTSSRFLSVRDCHRQADNPPARGLQARPGGVEPGPADQPDTPGIIRITCADTIRHRTSACDEVASLVAYFVSPLAATTNGAAIRCEGGILQTILRSRANGRFGASHIWNTPLSSTVAQNLLPSNPLPRGSVRGSRVQSGVLGFGLLIDREIGVGVLPQYQEVFIRFPLTTAQWNAALDQ